jgi:hypothetical protein
MKNKSTRLVRVAIAIFVIAIFNSSCSSTKNVSVHNDPQRGDKLRMNEIKSRAARDFSLRYPAIKNERWFRFKTGFSAKFSQEEVMNNVYYDRMGFFITAIRYYKEKNIPAELKKSIEDSFEGYTIISATESITNKESIFLVNIKSKTRLKTVKFTGNFMEITGDYRNADLDL